MKESINIANESPAIADFQRLFLSENGNNKITGQHGDIRFSLSKLGDIIIKDNKQIIVKKNITFFLFLAIIF